MLKDVLLKLKVCYYSRRYNLPTELLTYGWTVCKTIEDRELINAGLYCDLSPTYITLGPLTLKHSKKAYIVTLGSLGISGISTYLVYTLKGNPFKVRLQEYQGRNYYISDLKPTVVG